MRVEFHRQLDELTTDLAAMCDLAGTGMGHATRALLTSDLPAAEESVAIQRELRRGYAEVERRVLLLLARQAPVAGDLRTVVAAVQMAADADRMGGLAAHVAHLARRLIAPHVRGSPIAPHVRGPSPAIPADLHDHFAEMGRIAVELTEAARDVILDDDMLRASRLCADDEAMDELHRQLFERVMRNGCRYDAATAADLVLLGRFYERFADHAVEIARKVIFRSTGMLQV